MQFRQPTIPNSPQVILRESEVLRRTGLSRTTRWRLAKRGLFPPPRQLGANSIGWFEEEITSWLETRNRTLAMGTAPTWTPNVESVQASRRGRRGRQDDASRG
jgi:prophage regulatory protein